MPRAKPTPEAANAGDITVTMKRTDALALLKVTDVGLRVVEALALIQNTTSAERAIAAITEAAERKR